jgi:hypothetical protein
MPFVRCAFNVHRPEDDFIDVRACLLRSLLSRDRKLSELRCLPSVLLLPRAPPPVSQLS